MYNKEKKRRELHTDGKVYQNSDLYNNCLPGNRTTHKTLEYWIILKANTDHDGVLFMAVQSDIKFTGVQNLKTP
jgi:hypothetical protein